MGVLILTFSAGALLIAFGGVTDRLIPLFAIGAFLAFTLSQAGMVVHWRRCSGGAGAGSRAALIVNAVGCGTTAIALAIILAAKLWEGAWITVLLMPAIVALFLGIRRHYMMVARETAYSGPLETDNIAPPTVVVLMKSWNHITERALGFGMSISPEVIAVHIAAAHTPHSHTAATSEVEALQKIWADSVVKPTRDAGLSVPHLEILEPPYRRLFTPLLAYIDDLRRADPNRRIAVIIPELVEARWYQYLLHNQRATALKAALLLRGGDRVTVVNVPWYLGGSGRK